MYGSYPNSIDMNGRCIIPAKFRDNLGQKCLLVKGFDPCIYLFSEKEFHDYVKRNIDSLPDEDDEAADLKFFFLSSICECKVDKQGRISIPEEWMNHAGIDKEDNKEMVNVGFTDRIEIWSKKKHEERMKSVIATGPKKLRSKMQRYTPKP
ncbi:MAG: division/cell wall cluster transcriptional repressor MraZ [Clostridiales Family XIII bacterium]|jgi:MraZ protein|nr:division/cell wall cluster transcriptional repressor MraZ [Clostridiales Family XIII bacterium]